MNTSTNQVVYIIYQVTNEYTSIEILDREDSVWNIRGVFDDEEVVKKIVEDKLIELETLWGDKYEDECDEEWLYVTREMNILS
jgi:hypothetical protein